MTVKQISVFLENKPGKLMEFVKLLQDHNVDMRALSLAEAPDFGVLRVIVDDPDKAQAVLKESGSISSVTPVLAAKIADKPGGLCEILEILQEGDVNVEYTYAFTARKNEGACMVLRVSDAVIDKAVELLNKKGISLIDQKDIYHI